MKITRLTGDRGSLDKRSLFGMCGTHIAMASCTGGETSQPVTKAGGPPPPGPTPVVAGTFPLLFVTQVPVSGDLFLLNHATSGNFSSSIDRFGRVLFTQWDHLKRDQQADADKYAGGTNGTFTYASEAANAQKIANLVGSEMFPEPRVDQEVAGTTRPLLAVDRFSRQAGCP